MVAIIFMTGSEYAYNVENRPRVHVTKISGRFSRKQIFGDCKHIWSLLKQIANRNSPFRI